MRFERYWVAPQLRIPGQSYILWSKTKVLRPLLKHTSRDHVYGLILAPLRLTCECCPAGRELDLLREVAFAAGREHDLQLEAVSVVLAGTALQEEHARDARYENAQAKQGQQ